MELSSNISNNDLRDQLSSFTQENMCPMAKLTWDMRKQKDVLLRLIQILAEDGRMDCHLHALQAVKVFTRNKPLLDSIVNQDFLKELLNHAGISMDCQTRNNLLSRNDEAILEAQRCLSNIYLQCSSAIDFALENDTLPGIMLQTTKYKELKIPSPIISFDMKLLFLVTAQRPEARTVVVVEHRALNRLIDVLELILEKTKAKLMESPACLDDEEVSVIADVLKALFNLTCGYEDKDCDEEEESLMRRLCEIVQSLIIVSLASNDQKFKLVGNCVNLLTNFKGVWTGALIEPLKKEFAAKNLEEVEYDGKNMNVPQMLLDFLNNSIDKTGGNKSNRSLRENLSPVLKLLVSLSMTHWHVRKYFRLQVLPPLRDLTKPPEEGMTLRNKLCRLLTSPDTTIGSMVAEFLFILCKEKVSRFVKHTGYGNAAGLLARRGLMLGGQGERTQYSDTDSDSDTEEYVAHAHQINPVTGYVEPTRPSPFEGMTEEQKEFEANKLANLIHQLHDLGAMKPARIGPDGKPVAVEHVLQLIEGQESPPRIGEIHDDEESD